MSGKDACKGDADRGRYKREARYSRENNPEFLENCRANRRERCESGLPDGDHSSLSATVRNSVPKGKERKREREIERNISLVFWN